MDRRRIDGSLVRAQREVARARRRVGPPTGGRYNIASRHTDGDVYHNVGHFVEIVPNERLSFTWTWLESPTGPEESLVTLEFESVAEGTKMTLVHERLVDPDNREATRGGWAELFDVLDNVLNGKPRFGA